MKSLKELLEEKIERDCKQYCEEHSNYEFYGWLYKAGAASLVPLVVELAKALKSYHTPDMVTPFSKVVDNSDKALLSIEKFLEGK